MGEAWSWLKKISVCPLPIRTTVHQWTILVNNCQDTIVHINVFIFQQQHKGLLKICLERYSKVQHTWWQKCLQTAVLFDACITTHVSPEWIWQCLHVPNKVIILLWSHHLHKFCEGENKTNRYSIMTIDYKKN